MKPAKKRGHSTPGPRAMKKMTEEVVLMEPELSASEDEDDGDAERKHQRLLDAISALGGSKRKKKSERTEASLQVSEFGISAEGVREKVCLSDLIKPIKKEKALKKMKSQLGIIKPKKSLELPMNKAEEQKILRQAAYQKSSQEVSRWKKVVTENRKAEQLVFPLNEQPLRPAPIEENLTAWKARTPLEMEIFSMLHKHKQPIVAPVLTPMEKASIKAMSLEEAKRRRIELQRARILQSYYQVKARRERKIKSKSYRKVKKKGRMKQSLKIFEELRKTNPEAALEELEKLEKDRIQERMSLKHQKTGKWAKSRAIMAKYDDEARKAMQEQLQKHKELTTKIAVVTEEKEEEEREEEEEQQEIIPDFVNDAQMSLEGANPWMTGKLRSDAKDAGTAEEAQGQVEAAAKSNEPEKEESEEEAESEEETSLREFQDRRRLRKQLGVEESLTPDSGSAAGVAAQDHAREVSQFNRMFQKMLEENKKEQKLQKKLNATAAVEEKEKKKAEVEEQKRSQEEEEDEEEDPLIIEGMDRTRTMEDLETLRTRETLEELMTPQKPPDKTPQQKPPDKTPQQKKKKAQIISAKDVLAAKAPRVHAPLLPTMMDTEEEEADEKKQKMIIKEAFAGDDVIGDFLKEKRKAIEDAKPKDICLALPGWGSWGGTNLPISAKKKRRFTLKAPPPPPRKDDKLPNVIISENRNKAFAAHQPYVPVKFQKRCENFLRTPIGSTWNPERAVQQLTAPKVVTKTGHIIEPITDDFLQKSEVQGADPTKVLEKELQQLEEKIKRETQTKDPRPQEKNKGHKKSTKSKHNNKKK
ncbi:hypothetical protein GDO81_003191 [Engystomops pustulosus]|uniref:U3 small nucleolar RNA-associated protein 14 homolog A n=2 Tax=Engystomops pustulosus TaxID=76066 RepID=A0AAV6ZUI1_ENGPU|nr:hypothetical protein GDO81_003191 [Engystomops pustulosus]